MYFKYICKYYNIFKDNQNAYFILDYQLNKTLNELLTKDNYTQKENYS